MTRPLTPEEEAMVRGCDEQDFASDSEPMRLWATLDAEREKVKVLREAVKPFAEAWAVAIQQKIAGTLAHFGAIAKHEVSGVHFKNAATALATTEPKP